MGVVRGAQMKEQVLITGISGQDGSLLAKHLLGEGYRVFGTIRRVSSPANLWRLRALGVLDSVILLPADMTDEGSLIRALRDARPKIVFNLAAQSFVHAAFTMPRATTDVDAVGVLNLLEAIRTVDPSIRLYHASSSEIFGNVPQAALNETSPTQPASPYAAAKLYALHMVRIYREAYNLFAVNGILFNHCSEWRGLEFVTRRTTNYIGALLAGRTTEKLRLGASEPVRDFGYAPSYVRAMRLMIERDRPEDFVLGTGIGHRVVDFVAAAFAVVGLDWRDHVQFYSPGQMRPLDVARLVAAPTKAHTLLGWEPSITMHELAELMVRADVLRWQRYRRGEHFPWDVIP